MIQFSNYRQHLQIQTQGASASQGVPEGRLGCDAGDGNKWNCKSQKMNLQRWRIYFTRNLPNLGNIKIFGPIWTLLYKSKVFLLPQHNSASEWTRNIMDVGFFFFFYRPGWMIGNVLQAFTYYASEDKLTNRGNEAGKYILMTFPRYWYLWGQTLDKYLLTNLHWPYRPFVKINKL